MQGCLREPGLLHLPGELLAGGPWAKLASFAPAKERSHCPCHFPYPLRPPAQLLGQTDLSGENFLIVPVTAPPPNTQTHTPSCWDRQI